MAVLYFISEFSTIVNREIFVYENIHVLNVCANKFLWVPHENILTRKFCQVEITVHVLLVKQLLVTYTIYFATETTKCNQTHAVCYP